ncbi:MAG: TolC family protein [Bacteroidales bacterium]|nr:TolC family protein [Bacteroidales bacterium]
MRYLLLTGFLLFSLESFPQETMSLERCLSAAVENHPRMSDKQILESISQNSVMNINTQWKPSLNLNGQITYQSDVIEIGSTISIPGIEFPSPQKDQYKLYLDLQQTIFDGGRIKQQKILEDISMNAGINKLDAEIETVKADIIEIYYGILQLQESVEVQNLTLALLNDKKDIILAGIENGVMMQSDLSLLEIEILGLEQEKNATEFRKNALISILSEKCKINIDEQMGFSNTSLIFRESEMNRKEIDYMDNQQELLAATITVKEKNQLPLIYGFGQLGYGNPGLNMLNDEFDSYYYLGLGLKWNLWDWKSTSREKQNLSYKSELIDNLKLEFEENISNALINQRALILSYEQGVESLRVLAEKRAEIVKTYDSQFREGTIKTIDYLAVVNQEKITRIKLANENISLQKAIATYNYINGEL